MISYSIDPSIFIPPLLTDHGNEEQETQLKDNFNNYRITIDKCYDDLLIPQENISVYLFKDMKYKYNFNFDYKKASKICGYSLDTTKERLDYILDLGFAEKKCHFGGIYFNNYNNGFDIDISKNKNKYIFNDWFEIKNIDKSNCKFDPSLKNLITQDNELESRLIMIGILNQYIYKSSDFHFLIIKNNNAPVSIVSNINFNFYNVDKKKFLNKNTNELLNIQVKTKQIDNITIEPKKYETVNQAYEKAKKDFDDYLIFGNDVNRGIKTIKEQAGPPDRIFTYLETLKDFCIYKRNFKTPNDDFDVEVLRVFGCICTGENKNLNKKNKEYRKFDDGSDTGNEIDFELHLKPNTFSAVPPGKKDRTVRIYFKWDEKQRKVIIGWIGSHLPLYK